MSYKLKNTDEGVSSKLALFMLPPTDVGVERIDFVKYAPNSPQGNINFEVPNDGLTYVDLGRTWLNIKGQMKRRIAGQVEWTYLEADPVPYIPRKIAKGSRLGLVNAFAPS